MGWAEYFLGNPSRKDNRYVLLNPLSGGYRMHTPICRGLLIAIFTVSFTVSNGPVHAGALEDATAAIFRDEYATALRLLRPIAEKGDAAAQYELGLMFETGVGVPEDSKEAARWYLLAAPQGYASAQHNLAGMYANGQGVNQDFNEAVKWYRLAAQQGYLSAQLMLGTMYSTGIGGAKDFAEAAKWYRLAAAQGVAGAQSTLGQMYFNGEGVRQDLVLGQMWSILAAAQGNDSAAHTRDIFSKKMTRLQLAKAKLLAIECELSKFKRCD